MRRKLPQIRRNAEKGENHSERTIKTHILVHTSILGMAMIFGISVVLFMTNNIFPGRNSISTVLMREVDAICGNVEEYLGEMTAEAISFSETLALDIEYRLGEEGITFAELQQRPDVLFDILDRETDRLTLALGRANCSGVYLILNTTVNPDLPTAASSRAGIYLKQIEPKRLGVASEMQYLRGFTSFATRRNMTLQANWDLEFDVLNQAFWELPLEACAQAPEKKLSELYTWLFGKVIPPMKENSLLCSIPLLSGDGEVLGVCGFEITAASFRYRHALDVEGYPELALMFSSFDGENINLDESGALFSGDKMLELKLIAEGKLQMSEQKGRLGKLQSGQDVYYGRHRELSLYHGSAYYADERYALAVLMPEGEFDRIVRADIARATAIFVFILGVGVVTSLFLSRRIAKPFDTLYAMASGKADDNPQLSVGLKELDELLQVFIKNNPEETRQVGDVFESFLDKLRLLTPTERAIVARYSAGQDFDTVMSEMFIAASTLKTHNIHIYRKLEVKGVNEIKLYLDLIDRSHSSDRLKGLLEKPQ